MSGLAHTYIDQNREQFLEELFVLLRQPSVSTDNRGVAECAELLAAMMRRQGIATRILPTRRHPFVYGELPADRPSSFTVLLYGHYDVQPPEPLEPWITPPFEPTIRDGRIYACGVADDKGQLFAHLKGVEALRASGDGLPVNLKFLFEGEEEIGSPNFGEFIAEYRDLLQADLVIASDGSMSPRERPEINLGMKGSLYLELEVVGANKVMTCAFDPILPNAAWRMIWALSTMKTPDGRVLVEGFYDDVRPPSEADIHALERNASLEPPDTERLKAYYGLREFNGGVEGVEFVKRHLFTPAFSVDGFGSGHTGPGKKSVLPNRAVAKLSCRLVPDQRPQDVHEKIVRHLSRHGFDDIEVRVLGMLEPSRTDISLPQVRITAEALQEAYGQEPLIYPTYSTGGSGPDVYFNKHLRVPSIWVPYAQFDNKNAHAANENMEVECIFRGAKATATILTRLGEAAARDIEGRSRMDKEELVRALRRR